MGLHDDIYPLFTHSEPYSHLITAQIKNVFTNSEFTI
jgi:hypothetical protein